MSEVKTRFAPSPTGLLHVGNISIAIANWLFARKHGGKFVLRLDDTDFVRSEERYALAIEEDLSWLGWDIDERFKQSDRGAAYDAAIAKLKESGALYPCYETQDELEFKRKRQLSKGQPPIYDRAALKLSDADIKELEDQGKKPHWRLKLQPTSVSWNDMIHGELTFEGEKLSDPILLREDGTLIYTLSSVVDDIEKGITHVIRGDDHVTNTAIQIQLIHALGYDAKRFTYGHLPLIRNFDGGGLSKRFGSQSISALREDGYEPMTINSLMAKLGTSDAIDIVQTLEELVEQFDINKITPSSPKFSVDELNRLNEKLMHLTPYEAVKSRLQEMGLSAMDEDFWNFARQNIIKLKDVSQIWNMCTADITPIISDADYITQALETLPAAPWTEETWGAWTNTLKEKTGKKGRDLFMPLRQALTGEDHGPEMKYILPRIGHERASARLKGQKA